MKLKKAVSITMALIMCSMSLSAANVFADNRLTAFPGAEGGGMYTQGARAGNSMSVYHVTSLNDSGPGSFRDALSQSNRIIVFDVAGTIFLKSRISVKGSNLTILGQTAPGEGVCVAGDTVDFENVDNIILRYMRFRPGDTGSEDDGLTVKSSSNVIVDHCSISWSIDECFSAYANKNFTAQNNIISESLNQSVHGKGAHGYGGLWGGINASFHHNLISTHNSRNPRIATGETVKTYEGSADYEGLIDVRNNVFYNWGMNSGYGGENGVRVNFVNNYYKPSKTSEVKRIFEIYQGLKGSSDNMGTTLYVNGNVMEGNDAVTSDNWQGVVENHTGTNWNKCNDISEGITVKGVLYPNNQYLADYPVKTDDAQTVYDYILENAGASINRDSTDIRVINDVKNGTVPTGSKSGAGLIDSQEDVGGYSSLYGIKEKDSDNDGIPDEWENNNGLNPNLNDAVNIAPSGYTYIEEYANSLTENKITVDKSQLRAEIKTVEGLNSSEYMADDWAKVNTAMEQAASVLGNNNSTQADIDKAYADLKSAVVSLKIDYTAMLKKQIEKAEAIDTSTYTKASITALNNAVDNAKKLLDSHISDEMYTNTVNALESAIKGLEVSKKIQLLADIEKYSKFSDDDFTEISYNAFVKSISDAKAVYENQASDEADYVNAINDMSLAFNAIENNYDKEILTVPFSDIIIENEVRKPLDISLNDGTYAFESDILLNKIKGYSLYGFNVKTDDKYNISFYIPSRYLEYDRLKMKAVINTDKKVIRFYINDELVDNSDYKGNITEVYIEAEKSVYNGEINVQFNNISLTKRIFAEPVVYLKGDANIDGNIDINDVSVIMNHMIMGTAIPAADVDINLVDIDGNGVINSTDAACILQHCLDGSFSLDDFKFPDIKPIIPVHLKESIAFENVNDSSYASEKFEVSNIILLNEPVSINNKNYNKGIRMVDCGSEGIKITANSAGKLVIDCKSKGNIDSSDSLIRLKDANGDMWSDIVDSIHISEGSYELNIPKAGVYYLVANGYDSILYSMSLYES